MFHDRYKIYKVEPKSGHMRDVHKDILNAECKILYLELNDPTYFEVCNKNMLGFHTIQTSPVVNIDIRLNGDVVAIETKNTLYCLERI